MRQQFAPAAPGVDAMAAAKEGTLRLLHVDSAYCGHMKIPLSQDSPLFG